MTVRRRVHLVAVACALSLLLLLLLSGPVAAQDPTASPSPPAGPGSGVTTPAGAWEVVSFDPWAAGLVEPDEDSALTVALLTGGRLEGRTGCGRYHGGYTLDGERLGMGMVSKGYGECPQDSAEEAVALSVAFDAVRSWQPAESGTGLLLLDESGAVRLVLERSGDGGLSGDWLITSYARSNGQPVQPPADLPMWLELGPDGSVVGSTGCRLLEGEYTGEGDRIVIGPYEPVGPRCEGDERKPERRLLRVLGEVVHWEREGEVLRLTDAFGATLVELVDRSSPEVTDQDSSASPDPAAPPAPSEPSPSPAQDEASTGPLEVGE